MSRSASHAAESHGTRTTRGPWSARLLLAGLLPIVITGSVVATPFVAPVEALAAPIADPATAPVPPEADGDSQETAATNAALKPIVAKNPANDFATKDLTTIVMTGEDLPVAERNDVGVYTKVFAQVKSSAGWIAGVGTGAGWFTPDCFVVVGLSTPTEVVLGVGNLGKFCFKNISPGDQITVTLFDGSGNPVAGATATGTAVANGGAVPVVNSVTPPYGPETGGNPDDPATNGVTVSTGSSTSPIAFWFGGYQVGLGWYGTASTSITPKGGDQFTVVPPAFQSGKAGVQNYGVSVFVADAVNGVSSQLCNVLIAGCADEYLYMRHTKAGPVNISASDLTIASTTKTFGGPVSPACGLPGGGGSAGSVTFETKVSGDASLTAQADVSFNNANIPQAIVGQATVTINTPIVIEATLEGQIQGCVAIPFPPPLAIKNVVGLFFLIGGQINGKIGLTITIAKGTYTFIGGWLPGVAGRADTGGFSRSVINCVDESGNPTKSCITTKLDAAISGILSITPLWVQLGPSDGPLQANLGVGLTAAGFIGAEVSIPPWPPSPTFSWDLCVAARWAAQVSIPALSYENSSSGIFLGPYNIAGDGSKCPLGATTGSASTASVTDSTVAASPAAVPADGTTKSTVTVTLKDAGGKPVLGKAVTLAQDAGKSSVISAPSGLSDANGVVTFTVSDATAETVTYTATNSTDGAALTQTTNVVFGGAAATAVAVASDGTTLLAGPMSAPQSTLGAAPGAVPANGVTTATVTVRLEDTTGEPLVGKTVTLTQPAGKSSVISAASGPSDDDGLVTFTVKNSVVETVTYTARNTTDGVTLVQTTNVSFGARTVSALESRVDASPDSVQADGATAATITVTLNDDGGVPVAGKTVALTKDAGSAVISAASGPSDANGVVTFTVKSAALELVSFTATDVTDGVTLLMSDDVNFEAGPTSAARSTVVADPGSVPANGFTTSTVTVTLRDSSGHPVVDGTATLTASGGSSVISEPDGPSDDNGLITFTVTDTVLETVVYTATDTNDGVIIAQTAPVVFGPVRMSASGSIVEAGADSADNDGVSSSTITVVVLDEGDGPMAGKTIVLTQDAGTSSVISPPSGVTDANGEVAFTVTDMVAEQVTYTATNTTDGVALEEEAYVTFLAPGEGMSEYASTIDVSPDLVPNDGVTASTVTVRLLNDFDQPVPGRGVTLTQDAGKSSAISVASGLSDANGVVTFTVTDTKAETVTYTAVNDTDEVTLLETADVTFGPPPPPSEASRSTLTADPGAVPADGSTQATVTVILRDAGGAPLGGRTVALGQGAGKSVISAVGPTDANGVVNFLVSNTVAERVTYTATDVTSGTTLLRTESVTFSPLKATYSAVVPARLLESRAGYATVDGQANALGVRNAGSVTELQVTGRAGVPATATAVVLNVAVTEAQGPGFVTVFPCGSTRPNASSLNFEAGQTISNSVVAKVGTGGKVCFFTYATTHLVVDLTGQFLAGAPFLSVVPARLLESRTGYSTADGQANALGARGAGSVTELQVTGRVGVPATATAVVLNVAVTEAQGPGFVTVFPCGSTRPNASSLNFEAGQTISNSVVAKVGTGGKVCFFTYATTHLVVDVTGQFLSGSAFVPVVPARLFESRVGYSTADGLANAVGVRDGGTVTELQVTGRVGVPATATAVVLNVAVTEAQGAGFVTVFPCGSTRPNASGLNYVAGQTISNSVVAKIGVGGKVCFFTYATTHLVVDLTGQFIL